MTKTAVATMVKGIALDLAPRQITVNNVQPGMLSHYQHYGLERPQSA
jgi:NAD(P)-dependent dehydrogenase (short-subunit alcohol dehydrogenase family)